MPEDIKAPEAPTLDNNQESSPQETPIENPEAVYKAFQREKEETKRLKAKNKAYEDLLKEMQASMKPASNDPLNGREGQDPLSKLNEFNYQQALKEMEEKAIERGRKEYEEKIAGEQEALQRENKRLKEEVFYRNKLEAIGDAFCSDFSRGDPTKRGPWLKYLSEAHGIEFITNDEGTKVTELRQNGVKMKADENDSEIMGKDCEGKPLTPEALAWRSRNGRIDRVSQAFHDPVSQPQGTGSTVVSGSLPGVREFETVTELANYLASHEPGRDLLEAIRSKEYAIKR